MLAVLDGTQILVAAIGLVGVIAAATIPVLVLRAGQRDIKERIGEPNGRGNVVEMSHDQLDEIAAVRAEQTKHQDLDTKRFRALHHHLDIPFEENP